jgi:transporter family-2 protein
MSTLIETFGWFYMKPAQLSVTRIIGLIVLIIGLVVAVALANYSKKEQRQVKKIQGQETISRLYFWRIWGVVAGGLASVQQSLNGHLGTLLTSPVQSSLISFSLGSALILMYVIFVQRRLLPEDFNFSQVPLWVFIGGILGAIYVLLLAILVPEIGPGLAISLAIIGTLIGAIFVQQFGLFGSPKSKAKILQIVGIAIMSIGIVIIKVL